MTSIRRNLLVALLAAMTVVILISAYVTYRQVRLETDEIFDYHLRQLALSMRDQTFNSGQPIDSNANEETFDFVIQVWDRDGLKLYFSPSTTELPNHAQLGFSTVQTAEGDWRLYSAPIRNYIIQVAQPLRVRKDIAFAAALHMLIPLFLVLLTLAILIWILVAYGLSPLNKLALAVKERKPTALEHLPEQQVPVEVLPLVQSLNGLLDRLGQAIKAQRAFVSDAAHELRSPLTALQLQLQLVERENDFSKRAEFTADLKRGLDRMTHTIHQLLVLARAEPDAMEYSVDEINMVQLLGQVIVDLNPLAEAKKVDVGMIKKEDKVLIFADSDALRSLASNLIENSIRYTPTNGKVDVSVGVENNQPYLEVEDTGPGIPEEDRNRVFDRFYRREGTLEPGSGLGLAIVKAVADNLGATIHLSDASLGGLAVRVVFKEPVKKN